RENENHHAQNQNKIRIGELRRPGDVVTGGLDPDENERQADKPGKNSRNERESTPKNLCPAFAGLLDETENLQRDHRQNARHQIKKESADKSEEQERGESARRLCDCRRNNGLDRANFPRRAIAPVFVLRENNQTRDRG